MEMVLLMVVMCLSSMQQQPLSRDVLLNKNLPHVQIYRSVTCKFTTETSQAKGQCPKGFLYPVIILWTATQIQEVEVCSVLRLSFLVYGIPNRAIDQFSFVAIKFANLLWNSQFCNMVLFLNYFLLVMHLPVVTACWGMIPQHHCIPSMKWPFFTYKLSHFWRWRLERLYHSHVKSFCFDHFQ